MSRPTLLISGASGAIGSAFLSCFLEKQPRCNVICFARSDQAAKTILKDIRESDKVRIIDCDLISDESTKRAAEKIGNIDQLVAVHCAADVSWDKSTEALFELNVRGTERLCALLQKVTKSPRLVYVSTAFTNVDGNAFRNGYEETKARAEAAISFTKILYSVFSPSLVVGDSRDGKISRFNGIYPMLRFLTEFNPPFLVGDRQGILDIVPIDWVVSELHQLVSEQMEGAAPRNVVASAGPGRGISFERAIRIAEAVVNQRRFDNGLPVASEVPIIKLRQWEFLRRSLEAWKPENIAIRDFRYFERILNVYASYTEDHRARPPSGLISTPPEPENYMPTVIRYWLLQNARRLGPLATLSMPNEVTDAGY